MSQVIKIKHSITPTNTPASLETGELAINVTDGSLFFGSATTVYDSFKFGTVNVTNDLTVVGEVYTDMIKRESSNSNTTKIKSTANVWEFYAGDASTEVMKIAAGQVTIGGGVEMGTNKITGLGDPTLAQDGATKAYVDSYATSGVSSVAALTLGTTGTDLSSTVVDGTTTPVITLNVPTSSASNRGALSSTDWTTFNNKTTNTGTVTSVAISGSDGIDIDSGSPITSSGTIALGLTDVPNSALQYSSINIVAGDGLTGGGAALLGSDVTIDVGGGTGLRLGASGIEIQYTTTANFIDAATNLEGTAIAVGDSIVYHDADDDSVKKGFISDLPFTSSLGTVTSVSATGTKNGLTLTADGSTSTPTITLGGTLGSIGNSQLTNDSVSYGGVSLDLGGTDATPAFNLSDATAYPGTSTLITTGTITTGVWNSNRLFTKQVDAHVIQGDYVNFGAETVTTVGLVYYYDGGNWALANADAVGTGTFLLAVAMGTNSLTDGMLIRGMVGELSYDAGDDGDVLYLSTTNGRITTTAPTASGNVVRVLGYALGDTPVLWFNPDNTWVELT